MLAQDFLSNLQRRALRVLVDDPALLPALGARGLPAAQLTEGALTGADDAPALVLARTFAGHERLQALWDEATAPFSHLELARFDDSPACALASLDRLLSVDVPEATRRRAAAHARLLGDAPLVIQRGGASVAVTLGEELELVNAEDQLEVGWVHAVAEWLEAAVVNIASERSSVAVEGVFPFDGLVTVCNSPALRRRWGPLLAELTELAATGDSHVVWEDNHATRLVVGGQDRSADLRALTEGREREAALTELAIGCAPSSGPPSWAMNSVLNKVTPGVHLGIGMAVEIPHVAFVSSNAKICVPEGT